MKPSTSLVLPTLENLLFQLQLAYEGVRGEGFCKKNEFYCVNLVVIFVEDAHSGDIHMFLFKLKHVSI